MSQICLNFVESKKHKRQGRIADQAPKMMPQNEFLSNHLY